MKTLITIAITLLLLLLPSTVHSDTVIYDKDFSIKYRIKENKANGGKGMIIYDRNFQIEGYIKDGKVYDKNYQLKNYVR